MIEDSTNQLIKHLQERSEVDKQVALSLLEVQMNTKEILKTINHFDGRLEKLNLRLEKVEEISRENRISVGVLTQSAIEKIDNNRFWNRAAIIKIINIIGILAGAVLIATGIVNIKL